MSFIHNIPQMTVEGCIVTTAQLAKACDELSLFASFGFAEVQCSLRRQGVPSQPSFRAADRLLQKLRKNSWIKYSNGQWRWMQ